MSVPMDLDRPPLALRKRRSSRFLPLHSEPVERKVWSFEFFFFFNGAISASRIYSIKLVTMILFFNFKKDFTYLRERAKKERERKRT